MLIFANGYYSYHYNYLTTQLFDDLTKSEVNINCEICTCQTFSGSNTTSHKRWLDDERPLQNAPFCPISVSPMSGICQQAQIVILKILNVWMPFPISSGWLKFSPSLNLNPAIAGSIFQRSR